MTRSNATRFDLVLLSSPPFHSADSTIARVACASGVKKNHPPVRSADMGSVSSYLQMRSSAPEVGENVD
jgi:hypothetical protein